MRKGGRVGGTRRVVVACAAQTGNGATASEDGGALCVWSGDRHAYHGKLPSRWPSRDGPPTAPATACCRHAERAHAAGGATRLHEASFFRQQLFEASVSQGFLRWSRRRCGGLAYSVARGGGENDAQTSSPETTATDVATTTSTTTRARGRGRAHSTSRRQLRSECHNGFRRGSSTRAVCRGCVQASGRKNPNFGWAGTTLRNQQLAKRF